MDTPIPRSAAAPKTVNPAPAAAPISAKAGSRRPWVFGACLLVLIAALAAAAFYLKPPRVVVARAVVGQAVDVVYASGVVDYVRQAHVAPVVSAPIREVMVAEGQWVTAGQRLAQLEDGPAQGTALQLAAQAVQARIVAGRTRRLLEAGFAARAADDDAQAQARAAGAAADGAMARLRDYRLTAPFAGQILRREAEPGDLAAVGTMLFLLADPRTLRITADVDERDIARLKLGAQALIRADAFPGRTFQGSIAQITPAGDATGRVFRVRIALPADCPLSPGMTVETNLVAARREHAILVPATAAQNGKVWRVENGRARQVPVVVGAIGAAQTELRSGVAAGDTVIVAPDRLRDGQRVSVAARP